MNVRKTIIGFLFLISLTTIQTSAADTSFTFPLPAGDNKLTNNKAGHEGYLGWTPNFKVDFQVAEIPDNIKTSETVSRCYTYGAPILAAKQGTVLKAVSTGERHTTNPDFGAYVVIKHDDGSKAYYGHMITNTNDKYVSTGEKVEKGQILGLMGDTGYILSKYENNPCEKDEKNENFGTHLHFETRDLFDAAGNSTTPEPLGRPENKDFKVNSTYISDTIPYDPTNAYVKNHAGKYPYVLQMEEVHWITPLQVASGSNATFTVKGNHFSKQTNLQLSFCKSQTWKITDEHTATVSCGVSNETGLKETLFANSTAGGELKVQVDLQTNPSGNPSISEVNFIPPKPGEFIDFTILGKNLPGTLHIVVRDQEDRTEQGACDTTGQFSFLSPGKIQSRCRIPLNLGPVETHSERNFMVTMYSSEEAMLRNETPLYSNQFDISYGISSANLEPRKAIYYTPTRFTITGKNVHRTTIFFIEGCKDLKTIGETSYEQITFECFLQRLPGAPVPPQQGETQRHLFLFKTESKFDKNGKQIYTEAEDEAHVILSGYIDVTYDLTTHVDSIEPNEALEGIDTLFTIQGNNLPYSDGNETKPLVWLENCPGTGGENRIQIVPDSYTPYGFDFQCNPQFTAEEKTEYKTLETQYDTPDREKKKTLWPQFETFFDSLKPRSLHVKQQTGTQDKEFLSEQTVRLISALYNDIKNEESFQFDYTREDGNYDTSGIAIVSSLQAGSITRSNRRQIITVQGENLSYETLLKSDDCAQIAVKYGSSAKFEFVCLLKKVSVAEYQVVDSSKGNELHKKSIDIREVYDVTVKDSPEKGFLHIFVTGVNLEKTTLASSTNCKTLTILHAPSTSELTFLCEENFGSFSKPDKISLQISSQDNFPLFNSSVPIGEELKFSSPTPMSLINNPTSPGNPTIPNTTNIPGNPSTSGEMTPLTDLLTVDCGKIPNNELFIGECKVYSNFMREGHGTFSLDMPNLIAAIDASFDVTLSKQLDQQTSIMPSGLRINPMSGKGLVIVDMKNANMLINGEFKGLGFEVQDVLGYPFDFDLYDFNGQFVAGIPSFSLSQSRADSALVIGIGEVSGPQIVKLKGRGKEIQEAIEKEIAKLNKDLNQKKIELGAKLVGSIENSTLKKLARVSYIKILKALEIVPEEIAFFDNFDLVAKGKLKSEPFRPKSWGENQAWILEANLATINIDFSAHEGRLNIQGNALNSLSLFNNDILKADKGILNVGLDINLAEDNGRIDLDPVELRLPGDIATMNADAHVKQIFNPIELAIWGKVKSDLQIYGVDLAKAGAGFRYDPNTIYTVGDYSAKGLLQLEAQAQLVALLATGKAVFTSPKGSLLVTDIGGALDLDFLGYQKRIGDVLGRLRIGKEISACFNAITGSISFPIPFVSYLKTSGWFEDIEWLDKNLELQGGLSIEAALDLGSFSEDPKLKTIAMSGQGNNDTRIGLRYDNSRSWFTSFSLFNEQCTDAPDQSFFDEVLAKEETFVRPLASHPQPISSLIRSNSIVSSNPSPQLLTQAVEESEPTPNSFNTQWNTEGWKIIVVIENNENELVILDPQGNPLKLEENEFSVPGVWKFDNPTMFIIANEEEFKASGYQFAFVRNNNKEIKFSVSSYTGDKENSYLFEISNLGQSTNSLSFDTLDSQQKLTLNNTAISPAESVIRTIDPEERSVQSEIKSENHFELTFPDEPETPTQAPEPSSLSTDLFTDIKSPILREAVDYLVKLNIISGYDDNTFRPSATINRAEALKIIFLSLGESITDNLPPTTDNLFPDVNKSEWFAPYIQQAKTKGIISGYPDGTFHPGQEVNKAEFIKMAMSAQSSYSEPTDFLSAMLQYSDLDSSQWYMPYITFAVNHGLLDNTKKLHPTDGMTRGDAAMIIYRLLR